MSLKENQNVLGEKMSSYQAAGVSIDAGNRAVDLMREAVRSTYNAQVLAGIGSFGGVFDASGLADLHAPALVASTDGVGTKTKIAAALGRYETIGQDIVNHCINDILVQGARPLFFLDYIAMSRLDPAMVASIVTGIAAACRPAGCVLLGGETAEMPGVYEQGEFDLAGTIVGVVERENMLPLPTVHVGDVALGLASSGPHTNGYSLIRRVYADTPFKTRLEGVGILADTLLAPHRSYLDVVHALQGRVQVKALAHITGGGLIENVPRVLPDGVSLRIDLDSWPVPPLFRHIQHTGGIDLLEMFRVFNMGIGMIVVVSATDVEQALHVQGELGPIWRVGELIAGDQRVRLA
jgi:phosphoribosylformylglycinamidine cyclo-ligase